MAKKRRFTPQFKSTIVIEALTDQSSQAEICRRHDLNEDQLSKWKQQFLENAASLLFPTVAETDASRISLFTAWD